MDFDIFFSRIYFKLICYWLIFLVILKWVDDNFLLIIFMIVIGKYGENVVMF